MHSSKVLAFEFRYPWGSRSFGGTIYREPFLSIWHVNKGPDEWFSPSLTKDELKAAQNTARSELACLFEQVPDDGSGRSHVFPRYRAKRSPTVTAFTLMQVTAWSVLRMRIQPRHMPEVMSLVFNAYDNFTDTLGYPELDATDVERAVIFMARAFKRIERPWFRHPRWQFWRWQFQVHGVQKLKRFLFSRCASCGRGFAWGYAVYTHQWESEGPQWFRSERDVHHMHCLGIGVGTGGVVPMAQQPKKEASSESPLH